MSNIKGVVATLPLMAELQIDSVTIRREREAIEMQSSLNHSGRCTRLIHASALPPSSKKEGSQGARGAIQLTFWAQNWAPYWQNASLYCA